MPAHSRSRNGVASLAHSRSKNGVASLAYSRSKNGVASLAYSRSKNGVASLAYVAGISVLRPARARLTLARFPPLALRAPNLVQRVLAVEREDLKEA
jgi:hypothetical protein